MGGVVSSMVLIIGTEVLRGEFSTTHLLVAVMVVGIFYLGLNAWSAISRTDPRANDTDPP